jgi:hypothetical protein
MESLHCTVDIVRKVALLTLMGFLVVFLLGPVVTLLGVILPFALVGFLVWLPFRVFIQKRQINWSGLPEKAGRAVRAVLSFPLRVLGFLLSAAKCLLRLVGGVISFALRILIPALAGAVFFAVLGAIGGVTHADAEFRIPAAALIGAGIGALYGAFRTKEASKGIALQPASVTANRPHGCC